MSVDQMDALSADLTIKFYRKLIGRALDVVADAPYWSYVGEPGFAHLTIEDDEAVLTWPESESYYDSTSTRTESRRFPVKLLFLSSHDFAAWKLREDEAYRECEKERVAAVAANRGAEERRLLAALKAKYPDAE